MNVFRSMHVYDNVWLIAIRWQKTNFKNFVNNNNKNRNMQQCAG